MKIFDKRSITPPPASYTVADMKAEQVFMVAEKTYIRMQVAATQTGGIQTFCVNNSTLKFLPGASLVNPIEAEFHRV